MKPSNDQINGETDGPSRCPVNKPPRLKNYANGSENVDTLHKRAPQTGGCGVQVCRASVWYQWMFPQPSEEVQKLLTSAKEFIDQYFSSIKRLDTASHAARWDAVQKEIHQCGTYELTTTELTFGIKTAWRNASRCIGRIQWTKLQVFDGRQVTTAQGMFEILCSHLKYATNKGNIRSAATIFSQRKPGQGDFRVWNPQLVAYAGYRNEDGTITGDPGTVEFTEVCQKLGWVGNRGRFDVLPLVLQAPDQEPELFPIPPELVLEVPLTHPTLDWFESLGLRWFAIPAVSGMGMDCGGLQFPAIPFNGWYTTTEIGTRNLADSHRYNLLEPVAKRMGLDTRTNSSFWKDRAVVELNTAVQYSFQKQNVTIVDHHTVTEQFMKHLETENRLRGGCPAEWVWLVPPTSGSLTPVFHQEMVYYSLKPSFDYQVPAWKTYKWDQDRSNLDLLTDRRKLRFKEVARAVKFTSNLFGKALQRRIKASILYATETGKSEKFARTLADLFNHAFNAQVMCMEDYDAINLEHEALVLVVTSTFGNGDPPENGESFAREVSEMEANGIHSTMTFAVFALGSSAYPNFCAFGHYIDGLLGKLGGERLLGIATGDELSGQEQAFNTWALQVFHNACETFCLEDDVNIDEASATLGSLQITSDNIRFVSASDDYDLRRGLAKTHTKDVIECSVLFNNCLVSDKSGSNAIHVGLKVRENYSGKVRYEPGDHIGVFATNNKTLVDGLVERLSKSLPREGPLQLQVLREQKDGAKVWQDQGRLPICDLNMLLSRYIDITTPPTQRLLALMASHAVDEDDKRRLQLLATDAKEYEDWKHWRFPHLLETLEEFPSIDIDAALLVSQLPLLQPRFYSISSSPIIEADQIDITAAVISFNTQDGKGPVHYGVCSNYLAQLKADESVMCFIRSANSFHLPVQVERPVIMVGPGTGVAPFRGFWWHKQYLETKGIRMGPMLLFTGYRTPDHDLHAQEKASMVKAGILDQAFLALSRYPPTPKTYVQDKILEVAPLIYRLLVEEKGHFYVCGDCAMAEGVANTLQLVFQKGGGLDLEQSESLLILLRNEKRYHEDIFGITYRAPDPLNRRTLTAE